MILNVEGRTRETIMEHGFHRASTSIQDKKMTAPGGGTPEAVRRNKTRLKLMFQSPLNIISHRVWFCIPFFFLKGWVI